MSLRVAVCIATHNRREELIRTLGEVAKLQPAPDEILVLADGCRDGTVEWVRANCPNVQLHLHEVAQGSIPSRNDLAAAATSDIFLSLDDDSYPLESDAIARIRALFEARPRLAVASFPQRTDEFPETLTATDFGAAQFIASYANSAAAIRREAFEALGTYPALFFHMYEEPDFALRCVCAGWEVRFEPALTVRHHYTGTQRNELRVHQRHARNELWSVLMRCPAPQCLAVAAFRVFRQFGYAWHRGLAWALREPVWWWAALRGVPQCLAQRRPLPWRRYLAWMRLLGQPISEEARWREQFGGDAA